MNLLVSCSQGEGSWENQSGPVIWVPAELYCLEDIRLYPTLFVALRRGSGFIPMGREPNTRGRKPCVLIDKWLISTETTL